MIVSGLPIVVQVALETLNFHCLWEIKNWTIYSEKPVTHPESTVIFCCCFTHWMNRKMTISFCDSDYLNVLNCLPLFCFQFLLHHKVWYKYCICIFPISFDPLKDHGVFCNASSDTYITELQWQTLRGAEFSCTQVEIRGSGFQFLRNTQYLFRNIHLRW